MSMQLQDLTGKTAVITGASSGIGEAAAKMLAAEGVRVALVGRRRDKIEALAKAIGGNALPLTADVADAAQVKQLFETVKAKFGGLDLLFNNAGVGYNGPFETSKPDEWKLQIDANFYGVLNCTHAAIPLLRGRPGAMISIVSSVGGRYGIAGWSVYNATKFAVVGFHDALRKELGGDGIRVSVIEPGAVWTEWGNNVKPEVMHERRSTLDALKSEDIGRALVYAFAQPANVNVQEMLVMPTKQIVP